MSHRPILYTCLLVALISLLLDRSAVAAVPLISSLNLPVKGPGWQKITVDSGQAVGQSLSLAINPLTNNPYISYYDGINGDLKLAFPVSSGGDCGPANTWSSNSLKYTNSETFGSFSSIDFNSAGAWGISYARTSPSTSVSFDGTPASGSTQFFTGVEGTKYIAYWGTSFQYSSSGVGSFAYLGFDGTYIYLNFASYNAAMNGSCGLQTHWDCETIAKVGTMGLAGYPSLAYIGNLPIIAYRDTVGRLYYAGRIGSGLGDCPLSNQWQCNQIDRNSLVAGGISFLYTSTRAAVAYYDSVTHYMIVANDTSGACDWTCTYIEDVGAQTADSNQIAIAIRNGKYLVAYTYRKSPSNTILKVAYPDANGNCGPYVGGVHSWRCEVVDDGGGTQNVGNFISMAVSPSNVVYIAYSNDTNQTLKLAYLDNNIFIPLVRK